MKESGERRKIGLQKKEKQEENGKKEKRETLKRSLSVFSVMGLHKHSHSSSLEPKSTLEAKKIEPTQKTHSSNSSNNQKQNLPKAKSSHSEVKALQLERGGLKGGLGRGEVERNEVSLSARVRLQKQIKEVEKRLSNTKKKERRSKSDNKKGEGEEGKREKKKEKEVSELKGNIISEPFNLKSVFRLTEQFEWKGNFNSLFLQGDTLGEGTYGTVFKVTHNHSGKFFNSFNSFNSFTIKKERHLPRKRLIARVKKRRKLSGRKSKS